MFAALAAVLLLPLAGCLGGRDHGTSRTEGAFQVQVSPAGLVIPAGGGGFVTVTTARPLPHFLDYQGALTLALDGAPAGVRGSGSISADHTSGSFALQVDASVAPGTIRGLQVVASGGNAVAMASFDLTVGPPLPPGLLRTDGVQASGRLQTGGTLANSPVAQEPVAATPAADAAKVVGVRHGYLPDGSAQ